jgi:hypothetical protein
MEIRARRSSRQHELLLDLEQNNRGSVYYCGPAFHTLNELNSHYENRLIEQYTRFVKPSEFPAIDDDDQHFMSFREARGGPVAFFSAEGRKIEIDERPFLERAVEDMKKAGETPLRRSIAEVVSWLRGLSDIEGFAAAIEPEDKAETALGRLAMLSQMILNSTLFVIQPRTAR